MKKVDLIIFDLDGTLVDSTKDIASSANFTLRKLGLKEKSLKTISSFIGWGVNDLIKKALGPNHRKFFGRAYKIFTSHYRIHGRKRSRIYPRVKETLKYFKDKTKVILTNRNYEFTVPVLKKLGIFGYFDDIIGADNTSCMKPSACPINKILKEFHIRKNRCIIVGDMAIDVETGKQAGILSCAVTYGLGKIKDIKRQNPDFIIGDISELKNIIE